MDSILRPNYYYPERKRMQDLHDDLPQRAEQYFSALFDKAGDGILVLMGDLQEDALKKELCRWLGGFRTQKRFSSRPHVESRFATGSSTRADQAAAGVVGGREIGTYVARSAAVPFKPDSYMSFRVACTLIRQRLAAALAEQGGWAELSDRLELFPSERLTLYVHAHPCPESGLPDDIRAGSPRDLLDALRSVTRRLGALEVPAADLNAAKSALLKQLELRYADPETLIEDVLIRYSEGKDLVTDWKGAVQRVSAASVRQILGQLADGAEVEYLIY